LPQVSLEIPFVISEFFNAFRKNEGGEIHSDFIRVGYLETQTIGVFLPQFPEAVHDYRFFSVVPG
jgi:hypothetical protein